MEVASAVTGACVAAAFRSFFTDLSQHYAMILLALVLTAAVAGAAVVGSRALRPPAARVAALGCSVMLLAVTAPGDAGVDAALAAATLTAFFPDIPLLTPYRMAATLAAVLLPTARVLLLADLSPVLLGRAVVTGTLLAAAWVTHTSAVGLGLGLDVSFSAAVQPQRVTSRMIVALCGGAVGGALLPAAVSALLAGVTMQAARALAYSTVAGLATGLGGALVTINLGWARAVNTFLLGLAAGVMLLLSVVDMIWPVLQQRGLVHTVPLLLVGAAVVAVLDYAVGSFDLDAALARLARGSDSGESSASMLPVAVTGPGAVAAAAAAESNTQRLRSALLTALALAAHNAPEGLAVGMTSLGSDNRRALLMVLAIAFHNIPEGLAVAVTMLNATRNARAAVVVATLTGLVEPFAALVSVLVLGSSVSAEVLANALVVVGGIMITVCFKELLPEAWRKDRRSTLMGCGTGMVLMYAALWVMGD